MTNRANLILLLALFAALAGCSPNAKDNAAELPPPAITAAAFRVGEPNTVVITGEFFKVKSDNKKDVVVSLNGERVWIPATEITASSSTSYTVVLPYGVSFPQVWIRIYGINQEYSPPFLVQGLQR